MTETNETRTPPQKPSPCGFTVGKITDKWGYQGDIGPEHWGDLAEEYRTCKVGTQQSPINIEKAKLESKEQGNELNITYKNQKLTIVPTNGSFMVTPRSENHAQYDGSLYQLAQFHFHHTAEHTVNDQQHPIELHLVHENTTNNDLLVLGVFVKEGAENPTLQSLIKHIKEGVPEVELNLTKLLPRSKSHYSYKGSLTTPPCTECVNWVIFSEELEASSQQIQTFQKLFPSNCRPVQALNERQVNYTPET